MIGSVTVGSNGLDADGNKLNVFCFNAPA